MRKPWGRQPRPHYQRGGNMGNKTLYPWEEVKDDHLREAKRLLAEADTFLTGYACTCFLFGKIDRSKEVEAFQGHIQRFLANGWEEE